MSEIALERGAPRSAVALRFPRGAVLPLALLLAWFAASRTGLVDPRILVSPLRVAAAPFVDPDAQTLWLNIATSLQRMLSGAALGGSLGMVLGFVLGTSRWGNRLAAPSFNALRQITLFAWIPLLTAWFGQGEGAKLVFISLSALFPMALNTQQGLRDVPLAFRELGAAMRLSRWVRLTRIQLPSALPAIAIGLEIALINAWIGTVGCEYAIGLGRGLGTFLAAGREQFRMDIVLDGMIALALIGWLTNALMRRFVARLAPWRRQENEETTP